MTGPEHYRMGEALLAEADSFDKDMTLSTRSQLVESAKAHFLAAQVSVQVEATILPHWEVGVTRVWREAIGLG